MIELISDTVTKPTKAMLDAMMNAEVGDDVFRSDPTVNSLEERVANMFGKEAALFCPSGTMTNQIAIRMHTQDLDEIICDHYSHVYQYETAGYAANSGVGIKLIEGQMGKFTAPQLLDVINPEYDWLPRSRLVVIENSCNKGGGSYYSLEEIHPIHSVCQDHDMKLHLDGARLFNVLVETGEEPADVGVLFDSISICISKGLGAPVGSLLTGTEEDLRYARRLRKVMGGGMRQAGYLAAACLYALDNHVERLKDDNNRAKEIGAILRDLPYVDNVRPVQTNIVVFELSDVAPGKFVNYLQSKGISSSVFGPKAVRFVFHMDIEPEMMPEIIRAIQEF